MLISLPVFRWRVALLALFAMLSFGLSTGADAATKRQSSASKASAKSKAKVKSIRAATRKSVRTVVARPSFGELSGLRATDDPLDLRSSVALVMDQDTHEVLIDKNAQAVLPIASLTKLMTSVVVVEAGQSLDEMLTISQDDVDTEKGSGSRLAVGTQLTRGEMLHLA
ncbi:D-alanyl-D-alanine endopeptidase precursor [Methylibium sp. T29]|nr:D-alanyl-D-alanine endopeptidase precursor [Methylibium sp. T29]